MGRPIEKITLKGFKSIEHLEDFRLDKLNVLIGANGAGKSNFVSFFSLVREIAEGRLEKAINKAGGADIHLFLGPSITTTIEADLEFGANGYKFSLEPSTDNRLIFDNERIVYHADPGMRTTSVDTPIGQGHSESKLKAHAKSGWNSEIAEHVYRAVSSWTVYHFHDTSPAALMRRDRPLRDWERYRDDASNIAPFLLNLKEDEAESYELIRDTVQLIAPFFDDFLLRPQKRGNDEQVRLEWRQKGSDFPFQPNQLSDGTMRFICLATALQQPEPPATVVIDEPELGLHPYAISMLADLIKSAAERTQVIVSTQSATLLDYFDPGEIIVANRERGRSVFERLDAESLGEWLEDYSVGELWQKNVVRGGPTGE